MIVILVYWQGSNSLVEDTKIRLKLIQLVKVILILLNSTYNEHLGLINKTYNKNILLAL